MGQASARFLEMALVRGELENLKVKDLLTYLGFATGTRKQQRVRSHVSRDLGSKRVEP